MLRGYRISLNEQPSCMFFVYWFHRSNFIACLEKYNVGINTTQGHDASHGDSNTYDITFNNKEDVFKVVSIMLIEQFSTSIEDSTFCEYASGCIRLMRELNQGALGILPSELKTLLLKKNADLKRQQDELMIIARKLSIPEEKLKKFPELTVGNEHEEIADQNLLLLEANNALYNEIIIEARKCAVVYNTDAPKAAITSSVSGYLQQEHSELLQEAETAISDGKKPRVANSTETEPLIPHAVPERLRSYEVHSYIEPIVEFPNLSKIKFSYETDKKNFTITNEDITKLGRKIDNLLAQKNEINQSVSNFTKFFQAVKAFFPYIYHKITEALSSISEKYLTTEHKNLVQDFSSIVDGKGISQESTKLYRYNSRQSPLIAVIHASNDPTSDDYLSPEEKIDFLQKLATKKPCRSSSGKSEQLTTNIHIAGGKPKSTGSTELETIRQRSPLHHAVEFGSLKMVEILAASPGIDINSKGDQDDLLSNISGDQVSPLHVAVAKGDIEKVKVLLAHGASVDAQNKEGQTPLHAAKDPTIAQLLIDHGAKVDAKDKNGNTPLHLTVQRNDAEAVQVILQKFRMMGLSTNIPNNHGNTPLHLAAHIGFPALTRHSYDSQSLFAAKDPLKEHRLNNLTIISELTKAGCDANAQNQFGYTPLHMAVLDGIQVAGDKEVTLKVDHSNSYCHDRYDYNHIKEKVITLCKLGAKVDISTYEKTETLSSADWQNHPTPNATPLMALYLYRAKEHFNISQQDQPACIEIANIMTGSGATTIPQLSLATQHIILNTGDSGSLVHACVRANDSVGLQYFLGQGMDANYQVNESEPTPLHLLMHWEATDYDFSTKTTQACIDILLANGADINKTMIYDLKIRASLIPEKGRELCLSDSTIAVIFKHDNIFSQTAKTLGRTITKENSREILGQIYESLFSRQEITLSIPMTPVEYGQIYKNGPVNACSKAIAYLEKHAQQQPSHVATAAAL
jgi:ankyrin repeat protein